MGICFLIKYNASQQIEAGVSHTHVAFPSRRRHGQNSGQTRWRSHWEDAAVSRLAVLKLQLPLPVDLPQTKTQLWLLLHRSSLSTEDVSVASAQCDHLGCARGELDDAERLQRCHAQGKEKSNRHLTILLP